MIQRVLRIASCGFLVFSLNSRANDPIFGELSSGWDYYALLGLTEANTSGDIQALGEIWFQIYEAKGQLSDIQRAQRRLRLLSHNGLQIDKIRDQYLEERVKAGHLHFDFKLLHQSLAELDDEIPSAPGLHLRQIEGLLEAIARVESYLDSQPLESLWSKEDEFGRKYHRSEINRLIVSMKRGLSVQIFPAIGREFKGSWASFFKKSRRMNPKVKEILHLHEEKSRLVADGIFDFLTGKTVSEIKEQAQFFSTLLGAEPIDHFWARLSERALGRSMYDSHILSSLDLHDLLELSDLLIGMRAKLVTLEVAAQKVWSKSDVVKVWVKSQEISKSKTGKPIGRIVGFFWDSKSYPPPEMSGEEMQMAFYKIRKNFEKAIGPSILDELDREAIEEELFLIRSIPPRKLRDECPGFLKRSLR